MFFCKETIDSTEIGDADNLWKRCGLIEGHLGSHRLMPLPSEIAIYPGDAFDTPCPEPTCKAKRLYACVSRSNTTIESGCHMARYLAYHRLSVSARYHTCHVCGALPGVGCDHVRLQEDAERMEKRSKEDEEKAERKRLGHPEPITARGLVDGKLVTMTITDPEQIRKLQQGTRPGISLAVAAVDHPAKRPSNFDLLYGQKWRQSELRKFNNDNPFRSEDPIPEVPIEMETFTTKARPDLGIIPFPPPTGPVTVLPNPQGEQEFIEMVAKQIEEEQGSKKRMMSSLEWFKEAARKALDRKPDMTMKEFLEALEAPRSLNDVLADFDYDKAKLACFRCGKPSPDLSGMCPDHQGDEAQDIEEYIQADREINGSSPETRKFVIQKLNDLRTKSSSDGLVATLCILLEVSGVRRAEVNSFLTFCADAEQCTANGAEFDEVVIAHARGMVLALQQLREGPDPSAPSIFKPTSRT